MFIPKIRQNLCINTFNKDIYKNFSKEFQDPSRELLDRSVEFVRWCLYFVLETLFAQRNMKW